MTSTLRFADLEPDTADVFTRNHAHLRQQYAGPRTRAARVILDAGLTGDDAAYAAAYAVARILHAAEDLSSALAHQFPESATLKATVRTTCAFDPVLERILGELPPERLRAIRLLVDLVWAVIAGTGLPTLEPSTVTAAFAVAEAGRYEGPGGTW